MNIFELFGTIAIQNKDANKAIDETGEKANGLASTMDKAFAKIGSISKTVGKAAVAGLAASTAAMGALMKESIGNYADYEQLVGGVQTLFGDDASKTVMENAQKAFQTAGMSANAYMETVTGFSASLVASLKGDTVKAADAADMALRDMSDNANKMGTDMALIQNAYQGFAKQNYTMLDNLKLGYGGTQSEMKRLLKDAQKIKKAQGENVKYSINSFADIVEAIHVVQDEMGITGTTAAEANDTISGSLASTKAAWENLLTGLADGNQNLSGLITSFVGSAKIAVKNITKVLPDLVSGFTQLIDGLAPEIPGILESILPSLIQGALSLFSGLASALPSLAGVIIDQIPYILDQVGAAISTAWTGTVWPAIQGLFSAVFGVELPSWSEIVSSIQSGWETVKEGINNFFMKHFGVELPSWSEIVSSIQSGWENTILPGITGFFTALFSVQLPDWETVKTEIDTNWNTVVWPAVQGFFQVLFDIQLPDWNTILTDITTGWNDTIQPGTTGLVETLSGALSTAIESLKTVVENVVTAFSQFSTWCTENQETIQNIVIVIGSFASSFALVNAAITIWNVVSTAAATGTGLFAAALGALTSPVTIAIIAIGAIIAIVILCIKYWDDIKAKVEEVAQAIADKWTNLKEKLSQTMTLIMVSALAIWESIKKNVSDKVSALITGVTDKWTNLKEKLSQTMTLIMVSALAIWESIKKNVSDKVTAIVDGVKEKFESIRTAIVEKITAARDFVSGAIDAIKGFFNFEWKLPEIKLPHFSITGSFSLNPPSVPSFGIDWYKKAMENPLLMTKPTAFGINSMGQIMAGGEAGPEVVSGANTLMGMIHEAVASQNAGLITALHEIRDALMDMDDNMGGHMRDALNGTSLNVNKREFARLVKVVE